MSMPLIAKISLKNIVYNCRKVKKLIDKKVKFCAVIKSDAYGHGLIETAKALYNEADAFAVLKDAQMLYMTKEHAYRAIRELGKDALPALSTLEDLHGVGAQTKHQSHMPQPVIQALAEVLTRN